MTKKKTHKKNTSQLQTTTFTSLEEQLGFDIVNSIFGFVVKDKNNKQVQLRTEARYFLGSLLFTEFVDKDKFFKDLKIYFSMIYNNTPIKWETVVEKYRDNLKAHVFSKLIEYERANTYTARFEIS